MSVQEIWSYNQQLVSLTWHKDWKQLVNSISRIFPEPKVFGCCFVQPPVIRVEGNQQVLTSLINFSLRLFILDLIITQWMDLKLNKKTELLKKRSLGGTITEHLKTFRNMNVCANLKVSRVDRREEIIARSAMCPWTFGLRIMSSHTGNCGCFYWFDSLIDRGLFVASHGTFTFPYGLSKGPQRHAKHCMGPKATPANTAVIYTHLHII